MHVVKTEIFDFNELSEDAKEIAINEIRNTQDNIFMYDESYKTVKEFNEVFNIKEGSRSWLDFSLDKVSNDLLQLKGLRLRTYLINNFGYWIYKKLWMKSFVSDKQIKHKRVISKEDNKGNFYNSYYSGIQKNNSCVLTGMCYDNEILKPIYDFIDNYKQDAKNYDFTDFEDLIKYCFHNLKKCLDSEEEYMYSDKGVIEEINNNDYYFTKDGKRFN